MGVSYNCGTPLQIYKTMEGESFYMKKLIAVISALIILSAMFAVPSFAAEEVSTQAINLEKYGQKTYIVGDAIKDAPIVDGIIDEGEYSFQVKFEEPALWTTSSGMNIKGEPADEDWKNSESITYYYAWDEDNIYIAFYDVQGYKDENHWVYRNNYILKFGFNLGDFTEYFQFKLVGNGGDYTSVSEIPSVGMNNANGNTAIPDDEKAVVAAYATKTPLDPNVTDVKALDAVQWVRQYEVILNKDQLLKMFNFYCGTDYAELPNAMMIAHGNKTYCEYAPTAVADDSGRVYSLWNCAELSEEGRKELGTDFSYVPNVVIFGTEFKVPAIAQETEEVVETEEENEAVITDEATEPIAEGESTSPTVESENGESTESGCGSTVTFAGIALVYALASCATVIAKKRK